MNAANRTAADYIHDNNLHAAKEVQADIAEFSEIARIKSHRVYSSNAGQIRWVVITPERLTTKQRLELMERGFEYRRDWRDGMGGRATGWGRM